MKKIKIGVLIAVVLGFITYFICLFIIPQQTLAFFDYISALLNYPITVAGVTVTLGAIFAWFISNFILKNTKFGRKELDNIKNDYNANKQEVVELKESVNNKLIEYKTDADNFKQECENKVTVLINQFENLQNNMLSALKTIPNKKVQEIVAKYEAEYEDKKAEFMQKAIDGDKYLENKLTEMFNKFMTEVEEKLNEREEAVNTQTEEE